MEFSEDNFKDYPKLGGVCFCKWLGDWSGGVINIWKSKIWKEDSGGIKKKDFKNNSTRPNLISCQIRQDQKQTHK